MALSTVIVYKKETNEVLSNIFHKKWKYFKLRFEYRKFKIPGLRFSVRISAEMLQVVEGLQSNCNLLCICQ